jgi:nicotinate-nucleotide adenylyltransferase
VLSAPPITPWPAPPGTTVLLFGGSFDPPHPAHIAVARAARDAAMPPGTWLIAIPAARSPHKSTATSAPANHRAAMLQIALASIEHAAVWTDEIDRPQDANTPSFWIDTLHRAINVSGGAAMRTLIGADQAVAFHRWRQAEEITRLAEPLVVLRKPHDTESRLADALRAQSIDPAPWLGRIAPVDPVPASSTDYRRTLNRALLDPAVAAYIDQQGLYTNGPAE